MRNRNAFHCIWKLVISVQDLISPRQGWNSKCIKSRVRSNKRMNLKIYISRLYLYIGFIYRRLYIHWYFQNPAFLTEIKTLEKRQKNSNSLNISVESMILLQWKLSKATKNEWIQTENRRMDRIIGPESYHFNLQITIP